MPSPRTDGRPSRRPRRAGPRFDPRSTAPRSSSASTSGSCWRSCPWCAGRPDRLRRRDHSRSSRATSPSRPSERIDIGRRLDRHPAARAGEPRRRATQPNVVDDRSGAARHAIVVPPVARVRRRGLQRDGDDHQRRDGASGRRAPRPQDIGRTRGAGPAARHRASGRPGRAVRCSSCRTGSQTAT